MNKKVEVEGGEIALQNSFGDIIIVPKEYAREVGDMVEDGCDSCIDSFASTLPEMAGYAEDGTVIPTDPKVDPPVSTGPLLEDQERPGIMDYQAPDPTIDVAPDLDEPKIKFPEFKNKTPKDEREQSVAVKDNIPKPLRENVIGSIPAEQEALPEGTVEEVVSHSDTNAKLEDSEYVEPSVDYSKYAEAHSVNKLKVGQFYNKFDTATEQEVTNIQETLLEKGYKLPKYGADGKFGNETKKAYDKYLADTEPAGDIKEGLDSEGIFNIKSLDDTRCAAGMNKILTKNGVDTDALGVSGVDAWNMSKKMGHRAGNKSIYNIYANQKDLFAGVKTGDELKQKTVEAVKNSPVSADMFQKGDVVGLYYAGSSHHEETLDSDTHNTHVGFVSGFKNGTPIISHNIGGTMHHDPYNQLTPAWINRNESMSFTKPRASNISKKRYDSSTYVDNFQASLKTPLEGPKLEAAEKLTSRAMYNAENLPKELGIDVDSGWLEKATIGIARNETALGLNGWNNAEEMKEQAPKRWAAHQVKGTAEKDISFGIGKIKYGDLDSFSKNYFGVHSAKDLADPEKSADLISYKLAKNYDKFKKYGEQYPELGLTEDDFRNMSILSFNQGTKKLLQTGRVKDNRDFKQEVEALRALYSEASHDVSATNYRFLGNVGQKIYNKVNPDGYEPYISRVNRFSDELSKPNTTLAVENPE